MVSAFFHWYQLLSLCQRIAKGYSNATVRPSFCNILVNTLESTSFNGFGTCLVLKRIWNPVDFQGQRSRSQGLNFRRGDTPRFALPLLIYKVFEHNNFTLFSHLLSAISWIIVYCWKLDFNSILHPLFIVNCILSINDLVVYFGSKVKFIGSLIIDEKEIVDV